MPSDDELQNPPQKQVSRERLIKEVDNTLAIIRKNHELRPLPPKGMKYLTTDWERLGQYLDGEKTAILYDQIKNKVSQLSSSQRNYIQELVSHCLIKLFREDEKLVEIN